MVRKVSFKLFTTKFTALAQFKHGAGFRAGGKSPVSIKFRVSWLINVYAAISSPSVEIKFPAYLVLEESVIFKNIFLPNQFPFGILNCPATVDAVASVINNDIIVFMACC